MPQTPMLKKLKLTSSMETYKTSRTHTQNGTNTKWNWNTKVGSQEKRGVTGKFGLGVQNEAGQRLTILLRECTGHSKHPLPTTQEVTPHLDITRWSILKLN